MVICFKSRLYKGKITRKRYNNHDFNIGESRGEWNLILLLHFYN